MVRISSTEKGGGLFLKLCDFKGKSLSPSFLDCSFLSLENRSHGCSKDPPWKGTAGQGAESRLTGLHGADRHGRPSLPSVPHMRKYASSRVKSLQHNSFTRYSYSKETELAGKGYLFRLVTAGGDGDASSHMKGWVVAACVL